MDEKNNNGLLLVLAIGLFLYFNQSGGCNQTLVQPPPPPPPPVKTVIAKATYVYEKDQGGVPPEVGSALMKLNAQSPPILATEFEEDSVDGTGQVPDQYKKAVEAARQAGIPALVIEDSSGVVVRVLKSPTTEQHVMEAVKP